MPTETLARSESVDAPEEALRRWARRHVERVRKLKRDLVVYALGIATVTAVWALVEWQDNGAFERFSTGGNTGDWEPWVLYVALIWGFFVALEAVRVVGDRPTTEAEVDRELERLASRR